MSWRPDSVSAVPRTSAPVFKFCAPGHVFVGTEGVVSRFQLLRPRTRFRRYRRSRVPFSCCAFPDSFSAVPWASAPVFLFCAPGLIFDGTEGVVYRFLYLRARTCFRRYRGRRHPFTCFARPYSFRRYGGPWCPFACFARPDSFSAEPRASSPVFMFCAPGHVFGGTEGFGSRFHVLRARTRFRRYGGRRLPFS
jgi:hypothetical protein